MVGAVMISVNKGTDTVTRHTVLYARTNKAACSVVFQATYLITALRGPDNFLWL